MYFRKEHLVEVIIQTTAVPLEAQIAADLAAGAVLLEVAAHPAAGNSTIKNASPEAGIFKSDKVSLIPGLLSLYDRCTVLFRPELLRYESAGCI